MYLTDMVIGTYRKAVGNGVVTYSKTPKEQSLRFDLHIYTKGSNNIRLWYYWGSSSKIIIWADIIDKLKEENDNYRVIDTKTNKEVDLGEVFK